MTKRIWLAAVLTLVGACGEKKPADAPSTSETAAPAMADSGAMTMPADTMARDTTKS